jgi:hypothetical protein
MSSQAMNASALSRADILTPNRTLAICKLFTLAWISHQAVHDPNSSSRPAVCEQSGLRILNHVLLSRSVT